jgi:uncharacterized membrane protein HdeD (DUF308 family)
MAKKKNSNWWLLLAVGIVFILLSFKVFVHPAASLLGLAIFLGWAALIGGAIEIGFALSVKNLYTNWAWKMVGGIIDFIIGIIFLSHPAMTAEILPFFVGFWMIFMGVMNIFSGLDGRSNSAFQMFIGFLLVIGGFWISYNPTGEAALLIWIIGVTLLFYGFSFVYVALRLISSKRK